MSVVRSIESEEAYKKAIQSACVIDFYADWCGPCQRIAPEMERLARENAPLPIFKVDVDKLPGLARALGVMSMPRIHFYWRDEKIDEVHGANVADIEEKTKALKAKAGSMMAGEGHRLGGDGSVPERSEAAQAAMERMQKRQQQAQQQAHQHGDMAAEVVSVDEEHAVGGQDPMVQMIVDMGFPADRAVVALAKSGGQSVDAAVSWLFDHPDEDGGADDAIEVDPQVVPTEEEKASLEEKKKKLEEKIRQRRIQREKEEEAEKAARELKRIQDAKKTAETRMQWKEKKAELEAQKAKKERNDAKRYEAEVKRKLAVDKAERMAARLAKERAKSADANANPTAVPVSEEQQGEKRKYDSCVIAVRWSGGQLKSEFSAKDTVATVTAWAAQETGNPSLLLSTTYPRTVFTTDKQNVTLESISMAPRGMFVAK